MAVPKKKTSVSRKGQRRGGHTHKLYAKTTSNCPNCGGIVKPHHVCPSCGHYKGNEIIKMEEDTQEDAE